MVLTLTMSSAATSRFVWPLATSLGHYRFDRRERMASVVVGPPDLSAPDQFPVNEPEVRLGAEPAEGDLGRFELLDGLAAEPETA